MKNISILILHGWSLSAAKFLPLEHELIRREYKVYCPDLPGFGSSPLPNKPLHLLDYVDFVKGYLEERKIKKAIIIGHSFGGRIGIKLAVKPPTLLKALILTGAPGINPVPRAKIVFFLILSKIGKILFSLPVLSIFIDQMQKLIYKLAGTSDFYNTREEMRETFKNVIKEDLMPYLSRIRVPTLLLWGKDDKIVPIDIAYRMEKLINNSELVVIPSARHGVPWTHPKEFVKEVEKFLQNL